MPIHMHFHIALSPFAYMPFEISRKGSHASVARGIDLCAFGRVAMAILGAYDPISRGLIFKGF